jgi:hypothetical protein
MEDFTYSWAWEKNKQWWIQCNTVTPLLLSPVDFHSKRDFDRKSSSAQFEENGGM